MQEQHGARALSVSPFWLDESLQIYSFSQGSRAPRELARRAHALGAPALSAPT